MFVSEGNKRGVVVLILLGILIVFSPRLYGLLKGEEPIHFNSSALKSEMEVLHRKRIASNRYPSFQKKKRFKVPPRQFNPNEYSKQQWMYLGLSEKQANVVLNFTKRGVYHLEDMQRIFVIPDELFQLVKDSLVFPTPPNQFKKESIALKKERLDLNSASAEALERLPGIGAYTAGNIVKYRNKLGGFIAKEQLLEVYHLNLQNYEQFESLVEIKTPIQPISINSATFEQLNAHPYLSKQVANSIVKIRVQKGGFSQLEELKESKLINEELYLKIKPYITLE